MLSLHKAVKYLQNKTLVFYVALNITWEATESGLVACVLTALMKSEVFKRLHLLSSQDREPVLHFPGPSLFTSNFYSLWEHKAPQRLKNKQWD